MPKGFFITATDTGVGKTLIAGALIRACQLLGFRTGGMKPIESGCSREGEVLVPFDGLFLKQTAAMDEPVNVVTPCCFESPLAPLPASEAELKKVNLPAIKNAFSKLTQKYEVLIVEGVGGLLVPVKKNYYIADMAKELGLPLIIVARPGLGTINHIMLTLRCAEMEMLQVAGIIINYSHPAENSPAEKTNARLLSQISPVPIIGIFPYLKNITDEAIEKTARKNLDLELLRKHLS